MPKPQTAVRLLLALIDEAYDRQSWHGPNLRGALRGVSAAEAAWRPAPGRHSIAELTVHAAYWKYAAWRRLTGEARGSFPRAGSNWFGADEAVGEAQWRADQKLLATCHRQLRAAVAGLSDRDLPRRRRGSRWPVGFVVRGIAAHDLYHAGQIQVLKRLMK